MSNNDSDIPEEASEDEIQDSDNSMKPESSNKKIVKLPKKKKQGIIYVSSLPKNLNVAMIREMFEKYGEVKRIFLQPKEKMGKNQMFKKMLKHLLCRCIFWSIFYCFGFFLTLLFQPIKNLRK
jgi:RNA recognition motif-containing protein